MQRKIVIPALLLAAGIATAGGLTYAQQTATQANDAVADIAKARITLAQAVTAAEQHGGGRATRAELENENGRLVYGVEVTDATTTTDIKVDASDGKIISAQADQADSQSENGREEADND